VKLDTSKTLGKSKGETDITNMLMVYLQLLNQSQKTYNFQRPEETLHALPKC
jgi:hypothetical protein